MKKFIFTPLMHAPESLHLAMNTSHHKPFYNQIYIFALVNVRYGFLISFWD